MVDAALDVGITLFDTAESYGHGKSEGFLGRALAGRRDRAVIATKFGWGRGRDDNSVARGDPDYVRAAIDVSLEKLGTDHVDLYQYHRPDGVTPIAETLGAMDELVRAGKVRYIGHSNFSAAQVKEADEAAAAHGFTRYVSAQNEYSWLAPRPGARPDPGVRAPRARAAAVLPAGARPAHGKYHRGEPAPENTRLAVQGLDADDATWDRVEAFDAFARERGLRLLDVAVGGLAAQPTVASVIAGATTPEQVRANAAAGEWEPSPDELAELRAL